MMPLIYNTQPPTVQYLPTCRRERVLRSYRHFVVMGVMRHGQDTYFFEWVGES
jgi:hypothetical protein